MGRVDKSGHIEVLTQVCCLHWRNGLAQACFARAEASRCYRVQSQLEDVTCGDMIVIAVDKVLFSGCQSEQQTKTAHRLVHLQHHQKID